MTPTPQATGENLTRKALNSGFSATVRRYGGNPACAVALLVFLSAGYFQNTRPGWNVNSQFALTCALVELHTLQIDAYHRRPALETGDKVFFEGHFYSDKSPVTALLGVPAFYLYRLGSRAGLWEFSYESARYWTTWWSIGLCAAILAGLLATLLSRHGLGAGPASALAGLWIMATPLLGYSILFFNYLPACAMALGGYLLLEPCLLMRDSRAPPARFRVLASGFFIGLAAWTLPTYALFALVLSGALVFACARSRAPWSVLGPWILGGAVGASGYAIYSLIIFGEVTSLYRYEFDPGFRAQMQRGLMGAGLPDLRVLFMITLHPFRGLFTLFPITGLALIGLLSSFFLTKNGHSRANGGKIAPSAIALVLLAGLLLYNSGYFMWWGGWTYAPRHLIPALPLMILGLIPWARGSAAGDIGAGQARSAQARPPAGRSSRLLPRLLPSLARTLLWATLFTGALLNAAVVSLDPQPSPGMPEELLQHPADVTDWPSPFLELLRYVREGQTDPNWGVRLGLRGLWSLLPLGVIWGLGLGLIARRGRIQRHEHSQFYGPTDL